MPNRIIKESVNESRTLSECSFFSQDLYKRLITYADDYGRFNLDTTIMLARLFPRETDVVSEYDLADSIQELISIGKIGAYHCKARANDIFGAFPKWGEHQRLRNTRAKCPEPESYVNDWYYRRFVPIALKVIILERDKFKCQLCGKNMNPDGEEAKRFIKMRTGMVDFDHIVPVSIGGRATLENIRTMCCKCNRGRKRIYTPAEILSEIGSDLPQVAAGCRDLPPRARVYENPIQSESESESESESNTRGASDDASLPDIKSDSTSVKKKYGQYGWVKLTDAEYSRLIADHGETVAKQYIAIVDESAQKTGNKNKWKDWNLTVRHAIRDQWGGSRNKREDSGNIFFEMAREKGLM